MMKKQKVYISGIFGMLGASLIETLKENYIISGCDIVESDFYKDIKTFKIDLENNQIAKENIELIKPDVLIHCAAMIDVDGCEKNPQKAHIINSEVTKNLAIIAQKMNIKFIYISTDAIFDGSKKGQYIEEDKPCPINVYGETKLLGEKYLTEILDNYTILRTNIFGWNIQDKISFAEWIYNALNNKQPIKMFQDVLFTPIYVGNLASVIKEVIAKDIRGVYHAAGSEKISKYKFGVRLAKKFDFASTLIKLSSLNDLKLHAKRSKNMALSSKKLMKCIETKLLNVEDSLSLFKSDIALYNK